jgi:hypothetical protein
MLTEKEVEEIINKPVIKDVEAIQLIRKFIFDKTGKDIKGINRPTGQFKFTGSIFNVETDFDLMFKMFFIAKAYYIKLKN